MKDDLKIVCGYPREVFITALLAQARALAFNIKYKDLEGNDQLFQLLCQMIEALDVFVDHPHMVEIRLKEILAYLFEMYCLAMDCYTPALHGGVHAGGDFFEENSLLARYSRVATLKTTND